jgi:dTDP-4-dehydrorhamnose 3,5-epimerase
MRLRETSLPEVVEVISDRHQDARGYFSETFRADWFASNVGHANFVQENLSLSHKAGVVRGLHFQSGSSAQGKLVRSVTGAVFDVAVDIRRGSPNFGRWTSVTLSADQGNQVWIPPGFLHGFCTLLPGCLVAYKVTAYYDRDADSGVLWNDPDIGVAWPDIADESLLSAKDATLPPLMALSNAFDLNGE